jgi:hypothetical protein
VAALSGDVMRRVSAAAPMAPATNEFLLCIFF